ncbi:hypothetical protein HPY42_00030 [Coprothermobacteraceae bacterium]|nr:hypothetical protein [Coprothermobacteraceae bacterium]
MVQPILVIPLIFVVLWELVETRSLKFVALLALGALWFIPYVRSSYWISLLLMVTTYVALYMSLRKKLPWTFWVGIALLFLSTLGRTYLASAEPQKPAFWWLLPQKMAQRGGDFANNADLTRNLSMFADIAGMSLVSYSARYLSSARARVVAVLTASYFLIFCWYPTFEVRLTVSYLDKVLWVIGLIPAIGHLLSAAGKDEGPEADFFVLLVGVFAVMFAPPRGGGFELMLMAMVSFPFAVLARLAITPAKLTALGGLPPTVGFLFRALTITSLFISAPTVAIARIYMLLLLVGLVMEAAHATESKGVLPALVALGATFAGVLTGLAARLAVDLYEVTGALYTINNNLNVAITMPNIRLDMVNAMLPLVVALLASYVFFGEGR